ncbi:UDP-2,3-diacylglucosamine diphosphatase [Reichenbachiella carrageenanivorans]|uniref:UDP-2,3-diacylglucosamine diphosphatase n=1 Tax=Reichenbachiella carrageenanivorans TaxID=2979869 RepID=A0ABY6D1F7_9BACT|nr:UDP-2,3-diacylglucosamine diphosphatase [Reichenbachiella carrageenanivorans]UXX79986.1 UDP-2,3-diacylglucosamine diphosphatase [Reichenbachiella carrageenanivorans]
MNIALSELEKNKKIYFASDFHLGVPNHKQSLDREKHIVQWLGQIAPDAQAIFLLGDIFDFWFEYKQAVPKGFVRLLGKLAELADRGIKIIIFSGNHDLWLQDYLHAEIGAELYKKPESFHIGNHKFYLAHGDGLGPGDRKFKFFKRIFTNPLCQWMFRWLHPDIGIAVAKWWSKDSRLAQEEEPLVFFGDKEWLVIHSREIQKEQPHDFYVYGHRHIAGKHALGEQATYVNLGEWVVGSSYAVYDGQELVLKKYDK